jgi:hypothetical protein
MSAGPGGESDRTRERVECSHGIGRDRGVVVRSIASDELRNELGLPRWEQPAQLLISGEAARPVAAGPLPSSGVRQVTVIHTGVVGANVAP